MKYAIELTQNFRPDSRTLLHPGVYRIPEDMTEERAELAINAGATKIEQKAQLAAPENKVRKAKGA